MHHYFKLITRRMDLYPMLMRARPFSKINECMPAKKAIELVRPQYDAGFISHLAFRYIENASMEEVTVRWEPSKPFLPTCAHTLLIGLHWQYSVQTYSQLRDTFSQWPLSTLCNGTLLKIDLQRPLEREPLELGSSVSPGREG